MAVKPNKNFKLGIRDIEIIEHALQAKIGRRAMAIALGETSDQLRTEMREMHELLGRIHNQKNWYHPSKTWIGGG